MAMRKADIPGVVAILGATGSGKSALARAISDYAAAQDRRAVRISADALQVYAGLPLATNQEPDDLSSVRLVGHVDPLADSAYDVRAYVRDAAREVAAAHDADSLAVVVGGTNYYVEALLWQDRLVSDLLVEVPPSGGGERDRTDGPLGAAAEEDVAACYALLQSQAPEIAATLHPANERRVRRYAAVVRQSGVDALRSALRAQEAAPRLRYGPPRACVVVWVRRSADRLRAKVLARARHMVEAGLLDEVRTLRRRFVAAGVAPDPSRGIWQAIGGKELLPLLDAEGEDAVRRAEAAAVDAVVQRTLQYARKQEQWVRQRLLGRVLLYELVMPESGAEDAAVREAARTIFDLVSSGLEPPQDVCALGLGATLRRHAVQVDGAGFLGHRAPLTRTEVHSCTVCGVVAQGDASWAAHVHSRRHRRLCAPCPRPHQRSRR
jgi:tRNA dimethylallyltransferase